MADPTPQLRRLNLGCGSVRPSGWINIDSSWNANLQRIPFIGQIVKKVFNTVAYDSSNLEYMNLNKPWRFADNSVDIVYASHLFEHLTLSSADLFLREAFRTLKCDGVIRIVVPDLYKIAKRYINEYESGHEDTTKFFMWAINMHREGQYGASIPLMKKIALEIQGYPHQHKFMYDERSLCKKMAQYGFIDLISLEYGASRFIPEIADVEGKDESYLSIYIEGRKPNP
jgi:predicted SAM-dependent methyltransferase